MCTVGLYKEGNIKGVIYGYKNIKTNKWYVGQTTNERTRKVQHKCNQKLFHSSANKKEKGKFCPKFYHAVSKHGWDSFEYIILENNVSVDDLDEREVFWGKECNSIDNGYNLYLGGRGNRVLSSDAREKLRQRTSGDKNPMFGRTGSKSSTHKVIIEFDANGNILREFCGAKDFCKFYANDKRAKPRCVNASCKRQCLLYLDNYFICYKDDFEVDKEGIVKRLIEKSEYVSVFSKAIIEVDDDMGVVQRYSSVTKVFELTGLRTTSVLRVLRHGANNVKGRKFIFESEFKKMTTTDLINRFQHKYQKVETDRTYMKKKIVCTNFGTVHDSIKDGADYYNMSKDSIGKGLSKKRNHCGYYNGEKMYFEYI